LEDDAVQIDEDYKTFSIVHPQAGTLVQSSMTEGQFLEVNWFSKWAETREEKLLTLQAKRAYVDKNMPAYVSLVPKIIRLLLSRVDGLVVPVKNEELPNCLQELGLENDKVAILESLILSNQKDKNLPSFDAFFSLLDAISYYFIPSSLLSEYNPMCGMKDVLQYAKFYDQVSTTIADLDQKIVLLSGEQYLGRIESKLEIDSENPTLLADKQKILEAISINRQNLQFQKEEMVRIESFFSEFKNSIVLIGPEEKTFQDLAATPFDASGVPKVGVHGNLIKTLSAGEYLRRLPLRIDHFAT